MSNQDLLEVTADIAGAGLTCELVCKTFRTKVMVAFTIGDVLYIYLLRKTLFDMLGKTIPLNKNGTADVKNSLNINQMDLPELVQDFGGKLLTTYAVKVGFNMMMTKQYPLLGFKEMLMFNIGGQLFGHLARDIQERLST